MKLTNKILEAVNKGIKFALDDFEDDEQIQGQVNSKVNHQHGTKEYLDIIRELVDLGLPSGTLWFNYNFGVDCKNVFEYSNPEDFNGLYISWGEKNIKRNYEWNTYLYCKYPQRDKRKLTKYCNLEEYWALQSDMDNLTVLEPQDDVITHVYGPGYHIPTIEEYNELLQYTESDHVENYLGIHGLDGRIFKSKINQNQLFFPYNGMWCGTTYFGKNKGWAECFLQTSNISLKDPLYCKVFYFDDMDNLNTAIGQKNKIDFGESRYLGMGIRGVFNKNLIK